MQTFVLLLFFLVFCVFSGVFPYTIPDVKFEQLAEKFRVSIPNYAGIKNVAFNINRNHPFKSFEQGEFSGQVRNPINDRWEYEVFRKLNDDDIIYVWTHVQHNNIVYRSISEPFTIHLAVSKPATETVVKPITVNQTPKPNCEASITTYKNRAACKGELIFEENFDTLSTNVWQEEVRFPMENVAGVEFVRYDTNSAIKDGILSLKASVDEQASDIDLGQRCTGHADECVFNTDNINRPLPKVRTARINTKNSMSFKYGRIDIRAQFPQGDWLIPLLLLEPLVRRYGNEEYESGQIRIAYARGNLDYSIGNGVNIGGNILYGSAIVLPELKYHDIYVANRRRNEHFGNSFHVYSLIWTDRTLTFLIDDQVYGTFAGDFYNSERIPKRLVKQGDGYMAPFDQEFYITLGLLAGGHTDFPDPKRFPGGGTTTKPWQNTDPKAAYTFWKAHNDWMPTWTNPELKVDYVKVYAI